MEPKTNNVASAASKPTELAKTFAFFDIETTGLPDYELNKTKITELSFVACTKEHILNTKKTELPRVLHKLSLCINPSKMITLGSTDISGLDNYMLEYENKFNTNVANIIIGFLQHLQQPVCILAQNGDKFDFPILKKELQRLNLELPSSVTCVDSLPIFRRIDHDLILASIDPIESNPSTSSQSISVAKALQLSDEVNWQQQNETTPTQPKIGANSNRKRPPTNRELFASPKNRKFTLAAVYEREFGQQPIQSHYAEFDAETLIRCVISMKDSFFEYVDEHARSFADVAPI